MDHTESVYLVKDSFKGNPEYYLGNNNKKDSKGRYCIECKKHLMEGNWKIETIFGSLTKKDVPMKDGDHPEEDASPVLNDQMHVKYQMVIDMLNWIVCLGRFDVAFTTSSFSHFVACPREGHLVQVLRVF